MKKFYNLPFLTMKTMILKNRNLLKLLIAIFCLCSSLTSHAQLVLNEMSQGSAGSKEYIELVVMGNRSCTDSTADIRNWIIDDNNGWLGTGSGQGIAQGCMRFASIANWQKVPYGSIILIYNDADKNASITLPDDPSDANHDYVYVIPASSNLLQKNIDFPTTPSSPNYTYPTTGFTNGGSWPTIGLANAGDAVVIASPTTPGAAYFSFGYGTINNPGYANVYMLNGGSAKCYYLNDNQYNVSASWVEGATPTDESPGNPNSVLNANWINSMRQFSSASVPVDTTTLNSCNSVTYNGNVYTSSVVLIDTVRSVAGCDSVYHTINIDIQSLTNIMITASGSTTLCSGNSVILSAPVDPAYTYVWLPNNQTSSSITVTTAGIYSVTVTNAAGCSQTVSQTVQVITPVSQSNALSGCNSVLYNGITYTVSTNLLDTTRSLSGCDSVYIATNIRVDLPSFTNMVDSVFQGQSYTLPSGIVVTTAGNYESILVNANGCDSVIQTDLRIIVNVTCKVNAPNAFTPNGDGYNDVWKIFDGSCVKNCSVKVYNRYGSIVYESGNYQNDWRGTYKSKNCPDGTYYYLIDVIYLDGRRQSLKGDVTIVR